MITLLARAMAAFALVLTLGTGTALAQPPAVGRADLEVGVVFDDKPYVPGTDVPVTVTVKNIGTATATAVKGIMFTKSGSQLFVSDSAAWGDLTTLGPGGTIEPGASRVVHLKGRTENWTGANPRIAVQVQAADDSSLDNNIAEFTVRYLHQGPTGVVGGVVFGDRNADGKTDAGEGLGRVEVKLTAADFVMTVLTDGNGRFDFGAQPQREYTLTVRDLPGGWLVPTVQTVVVDGTDASANLRFVALRPLREVLSAKAEFTKAEYAAGDTAGLRVTLKNSGPKDLSGIKGCWAGGDEGPLLKVDSWGELDYRTPGVTIRAGETRVFDVNGVVPASAPQFGAVAVFCQFGADGAYLEGFPTIDASAKVAGPNADFHGRIYHDVNANYQLDDGEAIADTKVSLVDPAGDTAATATSDDEGNVDFTDVTAGRYLLEVDGPWQWPTAGTDYIFVGTCGTCGGRRNIELEPRTEDPTTTTITESTTTEPTDTTETTEAPPVRNTTGPLASTGASVIGPSVTGLLLLISGAVAVLFVRRRKTG